MSPTKTTKAEEALVAANRIIAQFFPLIGGVSELMRLVAPLFKKRDEDGAAFNEALVRFDASRNALGEAVSEFHAKFGREGDPLPEAPDDK